MFHTPPGLSDTAFYEKGSSTKESFIDLTVLKITFIVKHHSYQPQCQNYHRRLGMLGVLQEQKMKVNPDTNI